MASDDTASSVPDASAASVEKPSLYGKLQIYATVADADKRELISRP